MAFSPTVIFITSSSRPSTALPRRAPRISLGRPTVLSQARISLGRPTVLSQARKGAPRISLGRPTVLSQAEEVNEEVNRFTSSFKAQSNGAASVARRV
jgi:hypothetical protein